MGGGGRGGGVAVGGGLGLIIMIILALLGGGDLGSILNNGITPGQNPGIEAPYQQTEQEAELAQFVSVVLKDTETVWNEIFTQSGRTYVEPTMVLFSGSVQSACGVAGSSAGPFYCPGDDSLYIDLSFYNELKNRFNAPGDFAMAYVIAHEVGHHIQNQFGIMDQLNSLRSRLSQTEFNQYMVRLELQADYLAGVWAHHAENMGVLEEGDIEEALNAANAIGDDTLQREAQGYVVPDSFTHGTSEQRVRWFKKGYELGNLEGADTFGAQDL
jgi:hypothetical protein